MFVAAAIPTLNEAETIEKSFRGLASQRKPVDVVTIADGGSDDGTPQRARELGEKYDLDVRVGEKEGANIGLSCYAAVMMADDAAEESGHDDAIVIRTDADSVLSRNWSSRASGALEDTDEPVVFGGYTVPMHLLNRREKPSYRRAHNWLYSAASNANRTPKGRGMAFTLSDFHELGGYCLCDDGVCNCSPEWYEDVILTKKARMAGHLEFDKGAWIYTEMPTTTLSTPGKWMKAGGVKRSVEELDWRPHD